MYSPHQNIPADTDEQVAIDVQIQQLKRKRNMLSPISKLLPEIQIAVLALVVEETDPDQIKSRPLLLHKITGVCHSWRELALGCPMLWTHICLDRVEWAAMSIQRSRMLPVTIYWFDGFPAYETGDRVLDDIFRRLSGGQPQIQDLHLSFPEVDSELNSQRVLDRVLGLLEKHASLLESITVANAPPPTGPQDMALFTLLTLAFSLPKLCHFRFTRSLLTESPDMYLGFSISARKNLTTLEFTDMTDLGVDVIVGLLCATTELQCFRFLRSKPQWPMQVAQPTTDRVARLDNLTHIRIHAAYNECITLLSHISYHNSVHCDFDASCIDIESREQLIPIVQQLISISCLKTRLPSIRRLHLGNKSSRRVGISCGDVLPGNTYSGRKELFDHGAPFLLSFSVGSCLAIQTVADTLVSSLGRLDSVQQLSLNTTTIDLWPGQAIFSSTPGASDIRLEVDNIQHVCSILSEKTSDSQLRYVPHLSTLRIRFEQPRRTKPNQTSEALDYLLNTLVLRRDLGAKIEDLHLAGCCEENDSRLSHIRESGVVGKLHWCGEPLPVDLDESVSSAENSDSE